MATRFTYALVLTPFESNYLGSKRADWFYAAEQDYPFHVLYCNTTKQFVFFGDNLTTDTKRDIESFLIGLEKAGIEYTLARKIFSISQDEELNKSVVAKYL